MVTVSKYIYGEKRIIKAVDVRKNTKQESVKYKEERKYDTVDCLAAAKFFPPVFIIMMILSDKKKTYPSEWAVTNSYKVSLQDGSRFKFELVNKDMDLRPGDSFIVCSVGNQLTYIKCKHNGVVFLDEPALNPNWEVFKEVRKRQLINQAHVYTKNAKSFAVFASKVYLHRAKMLFNRIKTKTIVLLSK